MKRSITLKLVALNIRLKSNHRSGTDAYIDIFKSLFTSKIIGTPKRGYSMILRTQFKTMVEENLVLYGKISRFTKLDSDDWLNIENLEKEHYEMPPNLFPNLKEADYYFIPQAHRFLVRTNAAVSSVFQVEEFLINALNKVILPDEQIDVDIEQSVESFERILKAPAIKRVEFKISYTNQDIGSDAQNYVDNILRTMNVGTFNGVITPDNKDGLDIENQFLRGSLELAKSNGLVVATIVNDQNVPEKIITRDHPEEIVVNAKDEDSIISSVFNRIMHIFRS